MSDSQLLERRTSWLGVGGMHLNEYQGAWAIYRPYGEAMIQQARRMNVRLHVKQQEQAVAQQAAQPLAEGEGQPAGGFNGMLTGDGIAVIEISGTMMKFVSSMSSGVSTVRVRQQVRRAKADPNVVRAIIIIESGGGTVAGTQELADDIAALAAVKPTAVFVDGLMCSAALWVGSQASVISASKTSIVGSIGAMSAVVDYSKWAMKQGIKVHVLTSDGAETYKGAGTPGSKVTDAQIAEWRHILNSLADEFFAGVAAGRKLPLAKVRELATGQVWIAEEAKAHKLVDHVETLDAAMQRLRAMPVRAAQSQARRADDGGLQIAADQQNNELQASGTSAGQPRAEEAGTQSPAVAEAVSPDEETLMSQQQQGATSPNTSAAAVIAAATTAAAAATGTVEQPKAANMAELKAACPGAASDFLVEQSEKGATAAQAQVAFIGWQGAQIRSRDEELATLRGEKAAAAATTTETTATTTTAPAATVTTPAAKKPGVAALASAPAEQTGAGAYSGDPKAELDTRVAKLTENGRMGRAQAVGKVFAADPALHEAIKALR
ncbi:MAG TPA: S49 family peptidase [Tepidisphaeraceae bacterium]|jgi:signal peptide peptidase SppA|nr:S49 family peptidase [Tepidisphaeraceae bacterium]